MTDEHVDAFDNVEEDFVLAVADTFASPADSVCDCNGRPCLCLDIEFM